ncbi:sulfotransferase [Sphingobium sufflavum]|uniref:sulfotransferase family protein n=1 Tax=Sphingobium sufflavum TaxID=1129547 RepID=UPI001F40E483|nr:sulfotransferase [Sphingobium sufflavum]MCE7795079.1 sulfotransferase [Sphingobium sufflavum]
MESAAALMDRARTATALDDFGEDSFREGLEKLVDATRREARLTPMGTAAFSGQIVDYLSRRLEVEHHYARNPEIDEQEIVAPLIGIGLPRTGSSALACLLGADPAVRSIRNWEAMQPCPPPDSATERDDPRIAAAEASMVRRAQLFPRMTGMLPSTATSPSECQTFMGQDFKSQIFQAFVHIPTYVDWLNHEADLVPTYTHVKRILKLLQWHRPPHRWRLKNPSHSLFINALTQVFPDARFVMTHRDVAQVIPSVADLYYELHSAFSDDVDTRAIGDTTATFCELGMRRMIGFRDAGQDHRFFDIHFAPFQADPLAVIERLYAWLGEALTEDARAGMQAWRAEKPVAGQAYERNVMGLFGFTPDALHEQFRFYADRFALTQPAH